MHEANVYRSPWGIKVKDILNNRGFHLFRILVAKFQVIRTLSQCLNDMCEQDWIA